jgi:bacillithiol synthase
VNDYRNEMSISFNEIPRSSRLFTDYVYNRDRVKDFYQTPRDDYGSLAELARKVAGQHFERDSVADALEEQNRRFGSSELTFKHIEMLRRPDTVAVVTGQQAGLFTGPLFTILKALSAIRLAEELRRQGTEAVPVFWVASEDHDYEEVNHCRIIDNEGRLVTAKYDACWPEGLRSVGDIKLCEEIEELIGQLLSTLPRSEFIEQIERDLRESYRVGVGFAEAFARLMARLFAKYGVVLLDPQSPELKRIAARVYETALSGSQEIAERLVEQSHALESAGYHAQIYTSLDMVPLFVFDNDHRTAMVREGNCFILKATGQCRSLPELIKQMEIDPGRFSPSVALRPVVQDWLLPTVAYMGGPAEIAYFGQLLPVYRYLNRIPPVVIPRMSMTIIQKRYSDLLEKYGLQFEDLFEGPEGAMRKVIERSLDTKTSEVFEETERIFNEQLDKLGESIAKLDPTLSEALKGSREKIFHHLSGLRNRFINTQAKREETVARQIERLTTILYPNKNLQEREINVYYFLARYGYDFIDRIYESVDLGAKRHKLLYI